MSRAGLTRRRFAGLAGAAVAALHAPRAIGQAKPRLVVIGGGPGGATLARQAHKDSRGALDVTLVEQSRLYTTCFFSNLYLGGFRSFTSITHNYAQVQRAGVRVVHGRAEVIDRAKKEVLLADKQRLSYDALAVAPGIDFRFDAVPGYSEAAAESMPHAWRYGPQTRLLNQRLNALRNGDLIVIIVPPDPYRCPPAPYERASMFAHVLKNKGHKRSRIVIIDQKPSFPKQTLFMEGWEKHYPGVIEWQDPRMHGGLEGVVPRTGEVKTSLASYKAALVNVIPPQTAGRIAREAGLTDGSGFCPIDPASMKSAVDPAIFVIGDGAIAGDMPKSAVAANSQAKVAAAAVRAELLGARAFAARYFNTCWSVIAEDDAVKLGGTYEPGDGRIRQATSFISQAGESVDLREENYEEAVDWYAEFVGEIFG
jgi:NADPH-dependent 2,4-dienoyl-CoA reductase/sulfur reductase-like enzyme